jgi:hypothetical protein
MGAHGAPPLLAGAAAPLLSNCDGSAGPRLTQAGGMQRFLFGLAGRPMMPLGSADKNGPGRSNLRYGYVTKPA